MAPRTRLRAPAPPDLDGAVLEPGTPEDLHPDELTDSLELRDADLTGTDLRGTRLVGCRLDRPRAPELRATDGAWREVELLGARVGALALDGASLNAVLVAGGKIDWLSLRGAELTDVVITDAVIGSLDLTEAQLTRVALRDCRIDELTLDRARCTDVDLREVRPGTVHGIDGLRGATVGPAQLVDLAPPLAAQRGSRVAD